MNITKRYEIFGRLRDDNPHPKTELHYNSTFELLIAVLLSAQSTDKSVNKATDIMFPIANTPEAILALGLDGLKSHIKTIGLYNNKAQNIMKTCRMLIDLHGSEVPDDQQALEALPGVGRKTANVVRNTAFGHPVMAVDTHIFRVANRTNLAPGNNVVDVEMNLIKFIPDEFMVDAHHWLILLGRYTCVARKPHCGSCLIEDLCEFKQKTQD